MSNRSTVYVWGTIPKEKWSAFAPDFSEIDDNIEYQEREDEFDIPNEAAAVETRPNQKQTTREPFVDIITPDPLNATVAVALNGSNTDQHIRAYAMGHEADELDSFVCALVLDDVISPDTFKFAQAAIGAVIVQPDVGQRGKRRREDR